jgi:hypothetical protein
MEVWEAVVAVAVALVAAPQRLAAMAALVALRKSSP